MKKRGKTTFHIVTLFPNMFDSYLGESILARGKKEGAIDFKFYNPRDFSPAGKTAKKNEKVKFPGKPYVRVDDKPYGGGPGMVMQALPVIKAIESAFKRITRRAKKPATSYKLPATIPPLLCPELRRSSLRGRRSELC